MRYERDTVDRVRSIMGPGNPVPNDPRAGAWRDLDGQETLDQILALSEQDAGAVPSRARPGQARPAGRLLPLSARARHVIGPITAGLAVAGLIAGLMIAGSSAASRPATGAPTAAGAGLPKFYVTLSEPGRSTNIVAQVHASLTGRVLSRVTVGPARSVVGITADRSDRAFVIDTTVRKSGQDVVGLFLLRVSASGRSARLARLPITLTSPHSHNVVDGIAASPDGTRLAVAVQVIKNPNPNVLNPRAEIVVYSLTGGGTQTWVAPRHEALPLNPVWTSGSRQLTFLWQDHLKGTGEFYTGRSQVRVLDTAAPGRNLLSSRVIATGGGRLGFIQAALAGPLDSPVIAATFRDIPASGASGTAIVQLAGLSPGGTVTKIFARHSIAYHSRAQMITVDTNCQVLGIDAAGRHTLAYCPDFGRIDNGRFTPLPHNSGEFAAAW
jgi:hypothetical protein